MTTTIRHYSYAPESLDTYTDGDLIVERDDDVVRIDAVVGDESEYPMGRPGVSIEMDPEKASALGIHVLLASRLKVFHCGMGEACWYSAVIPGFFAVDPTPGVHEDVAGAMNCVRRAHNIAALAPQPTELNPDADDIIASTIAGEDEVTDEAVAQADRILDDLKASGFKVVRA